MFRRLLNGTEIKLGCPAAIQMVKVRFLSQDGRFLNSNSKLRACGYGREIMMLRSSESTSIPPTYFSAAP